MSLIATQVLDVSTGTPPTFAAAANGDTAECGPTDTLIVKNGSGSSVTITITTPATLPSGDAYPDKAYAIAAGAERWIPLIADFKDPANNGQAAIAYTALTSVTRAVVRR